MAKIRRYGAAARFPFPCRRPRRAMEVEFKWPAPMMPRASTAQNAQDRKGTTADQSSAEPWAAPRSYGGTSGAPAAAAVNVGPPSRVPLLSRVASAFRFCWYGSTAFVFQIWRFSCLWPRASKWAAFFGRAACRSVYRGCRQCAVCVGRARGRWGNRLKWRRFQASVFDTLDIH